MPLQELLEVAIGLIFAWLVLSIATMQVQEWIASYLGWRAKDLENSIRNMLGDPTWAEQLYQHPIIQGLSKKTGIKPSYIPANQFAVALFDVVMTAGTDGSIIQRQLLELKAKKPESLKEFLQLIPARWWDQIKTWLIPLTNYLFGEKNQTTTMLYATLLEYAGEAGSSLDSLKNLITELSKADKITKISRLYPGLDQTLNKIYHQISRQLINSKEYLKKFPPPSDPKDLESLTALLQALDEYSGDENAKVDPRIITGVGTLLRAKNSLEQLKKLFNLTSSSENTLDKLSTSLEAIAESNPLLHKSINTLKPDIKDFTQKIEEINEKTLGIIQEREKHLQETRLEAENWFNDVMERAQGWYKRKAQIWAFVIGLLAACLLNIDSVQLSIKLWREPILRQATAGYVDNWMQGKTVEDLGKQNIQAISRELEALKLPIGWDFYMWDAIFNSDPETRSAIPVACQQLDITPPPVSGQPIEPKFIPPPANGAFLNKCIVIMDLPKTTGDWWIKLLGFLISAGAAMQGAPFWFDILKKLVNVRGTGTNPAEKPQDESISAMRQVNS
jgi:hypothetical protein